MSILGNETMAHIGAKFTGKPRVITSSGQKDLFRSPSIGSYRRNDPDTSKSAARSIEVTNLEYEVVIALAQRGDMTSHELAEYLNLSLVSVSPRLAPLVRKGKVKDSGERRAGPSGRKSIVWCLA